MEGDGEAEGSQAWLLRAFRCGPRARGLRTWRSCGLSGPPEGSLQGQSSEAFLSDRDGREP